jgi:hypothetical protein
VLLVRRRIFNVNRDCAKIVRQLALSSGPERSKVRARPTDKHPANVHFLLLIATKVCMCNLACSPNLPPRISHVYPASTTLSSPRRSFYNLCLTRLPCAQVGDGSGDGRESRPTVGIETAVSRVEEEGRGVRKQGEWQWPVARSEAIALRIWPSTFFLI